MARDNATPFSHTLGKVDARHRNPFNAILLTGVLTLALGFIYLGTATGFNAFVGSFVVLTCLSYLAAILPHLLHQRRGIQPGWFWMNGAIGFIINIISCVYIIVFTVIFCFPFSLPVSGGTMNYCSVIVGGVSLFVGGFWWWREGEYAGPRYVPPTKEMLARDAI